MKIAKGECCPPKKVKISDVPYGALVRLETTQHIRLYIVCKPPPSMQGRSVGYVWVVRIDDGHIFKKNQRTFAVVLEDAEVCLNENS